jgi:hypothetical protein
MTRSLGAALEYADQLGLAVLPVDPDRKRPLTPNGWKDASSDPEEVFQRREDYYWMGVAAATGSPSGVFVLDVDVGAGRDGMAALAALERRNAPLPITWRSQTPRGGRHLYFEQPADRDLRNHAGLRVPGFNPSGIDVRATGGIAILPPTVSSRGRYRWLDDPLATRLAAAPEWLLRLIGQPPRESTSPLGGVRFPGTDQLARYVASAVRSECDDVARTPRGARNTRLFQAAANLGEMVGANWLPREATERALMEAAVTCGLVAEGGVNAALATIASGLAKGVANPRRLRR